MHKLNVSLDELLQTLATKSGLLGVSGISGDMRDISARRDAGDERARLAAAAASGGAFAAMLPVIGNYCLFDALSHGGSVSWGYVGLAALVTAPAVAFFILLGVGFSRERDAA